jgi:hypothetical protein
VAIIGIGIGVAVAIAVAIGFCRPTQPIAIATATPIPIPTDMVFSFLFDTAKCQPTYELIGKMELVMEEELKCRRSERRRAKMSIMCIHPEAAG